MKIYSDNIIFSLQKSGGISIYFYEIFKRFLRDGVDFKMLDSGGRVDNIFYKNLLPLKNLIPEKKRLLKKFIRYSDTEIKSSDKFIFHSTYYRICKSKNAINVTTVHDFTYEKYFKGIKKKIHSYQKKRAILKSDLIICISENTKKDLMNYIPEAKNKKIEVVYNGVSEEFSRKENVENDFDRIYSSQKYILFVGARRGYKNFEIVLKIFSKLKNEYKLIFVGGEKLLNKEKEKIEKAIGKNYEHLIGINIEKLNSLYNYAFCLIYPSNYEGFGIPILEAMRAGCPVLAYENSSIPEISGPSLLMKNNLVEEYLEKIEELKSNERRKELIRKGVDFSKNFSWEKTYYDIKKIYISLEKDK